MFCFVVKFIAHAQNGDMQAAQPDDERCALRGSCSSSSFQADTQAQQNGAIIMTKFELCRLKNKDDDYDDDDDDDDDDDEKPDETVFCNSGFITLSQSGAVKQIFCLGSVLDHRLLVEC